MKNLIVLLVLFSFVLVPFNTNAWNIDYSKTQIKVSWKNYTLTKVKDLLYKNITNKVNQKQTESLKIDSYNSFIKTLDKIIIQSKKSSKTQNIYLWYMIEDLKALLNNDLEKIINKTSQIEDKKEVLENTSIEWVKLDENFKITTSMDYKLSKNLLWESNKIIREKYYKIAENLYKNSNWNIKYDIDLSELINNSENKLIEWVNNEAIKNQRIKISENWKATLTKVNINFVVDWMWIEVVEYYNNWQSFWFWFSWRWYSELSRLPWFKEVKASIIIINDIYQQNFVYSSSQEWVKLDENSSISSWEVSISKDFVIKTSFDRKISKWILSDSNKIIYQKYISIASKIYYSWWKITNLTDLSSLVDNSENKFVSWIDYAKINSQRAETSWNWKASLTSINISFTVDWMWIEITEYYSNDRNFSYWYGWMWFTDVKSAIERNWEYKASVGKVNWEKPWQNFWQ